MEKNKYKRHRMFEMDNTYTPANQRTYKMNEHKNKPSPLQPQPEQKNTASSRTPLVQDKIKLIDYSDDQYVTKMNAPSGVQWTKTGYIPGDNDETGLDKAYKNTSNLYLDKDGTLYVSGTKGGFFGSE